MFDYIRDRYRKDKAETEMKGFVLMLNNRDVPTLYLFRLNTNEGE
jgi:hypothetical protein